MVNVELIYVREDRTSVHLRMALPADSLVEELLIKSNIYLSHPETKDCAVGVFGKIVSLDMPLRDGDRVELYRPLFLDPKEKRRRLARRKR